MSANTQLRLMVVLTGPLYQYIRYHLPLGVELVSHWHQHKSFLGVNSGCPEKVRQQCTVRGARQLSTSFTLSLRCQPRSHALPARFHILLPLIDFYPSWFYCPCDSVQWNVSRQMVRLVTALKAQVNELSGSVWGSWDTWDITEIINGAFPAIL